MSLAGKTLFITGASRGIGLAIALRAARDGANIAIAAKTAEPHTHLPGTIYTAAEEIEQAGGKALPLVCDIRFEDQVPAAVEATVAKFGGIDICVNNASAISLTGTEATEMKRFDLMHQINARGTFLIVQDLHPASLKRAANPHVLMLSPPLDMSPNWFAAHTAYTMAKFGMSLCVLGMAEEFKGRIAFNALWPRTAIATAAIHNCAGRRGGACAIAASRRSWPTRPTHVFNRPKSFSGNFLIDDSFLAGEWRQRLRPVPGRSLQGPAAGLLCARRRAAAGGREPESQDPNWASWPDCPVAAPAGGVQGATEGAGTGTGGPKPCSFRVRRTSILRSDCTLRKSRLATQTWIFSSTCGPLSVSTHTCGAGCFSTSAVARHGLAGWPLRGGDIGLAVDVDLEIGTPERLARDVDDGAGEDDGIGHRDEQPVIGDQFGVEQADLLHRAGDGADGDPVGHPERPQQQQHHAGRDIGQGALQRQADGQARRAQKRDQRGGLHPELAQHRHQGDRDHAIAGEIDHQRLEGLVDMMRCAGTASRSQRASQRDSDPARDQDQRPRSGYSRRHGSAFRSGRARASTSAGKAATEGRWRAREGLPSLAFEPIFGVAAFGDNA